MNPSLHSELKTISDGTPCLNEPYQPIRLELKTAVYDDAAKSCDAMKPTLTFEILLTDYGETMPAI
jgi:hypothetical protein